MVKNQFKILLVLTAIVLTACTGGESGTALPYTEDFDDGESCFNTDDLVSIEDGELVVAVSGTNKLHWSNCPDVSLSDYTIEFDVYDDSSSEGFRFFGLQLRLDAAAGDSGQYYVVRFGLGGDSEPSSCVALATATSFTGLTESPAGDSCWVVLSEPIQAGEWNHIEITMNGSEISYMVNDGPATTIIDSSLTEGALAILAGTNSADSARVKFDNIRITAIGE